MGTAINILWIVVVLMSAYAAAIIQRFIRKYRSRMFKRSADIFFEHGYLKSNLFYLHYFKRVPNTVDIAGIDLSKAAKYIRDQYAGEILDVYQASTFNREESIFDYDDTFFLLKNRIVITASGTWITVLHPAEFWQWAEDFIKVMDGFKLPEKEEDFEINIITAGQRGLELKRMPIKPTVLDTTLYYNDDFFPVDLLIRERLGTNEDKGIVLLHGLPGTGKTTYLRNLVGALKKKVLFVSPSVAGNLMNPDFIDLLIENPNSVLVIEDAENIMMDRKFNSDSSVSNLLNISDGLLSDCLNVQVICTFNNAVNLIDPALMRKGRLIARYEFGKLEVRKAQVLSAHLGFDTAISEAMTLAEIANQNEVSPVVRKVEVIGFRRQEAVMN